MIDLLLIETGSGGDLLLQGADLATGAGLENAPYLAMFSGAADWWGNALLTSEGPAAVFSSQTEAALNRYALTSDGRQRIEEAIRADLQPVADATPGTEITVRTAITNPDRLEILITIDGEAFAYQWNPAAASLNAKV